MLNPLPRLLFALTLTSGLAWGDEGPLPVHVGAYDASILYTGHFDRRDPAGPKCAWSACAASLRFSGSAVNLRLSESGGQARGQKGVNQWQVVLDGQPVQVLAPPQGEGVYRIASDLAPGEHRIELVRRTEGSLGVSQMRGFELSQGGTPLPPQARGRLIETIGDSIVCAYGNEAATPEESFGIATENAYMSFGAIAARAVQADYSSLCWTGMMLRGLQRSAASLFLKNSPAHMAPDVDFFRATPDAVLINLGTNDFAKGNPEEQAWSDAYKTLIARVRARYPRAIIYLATSPMLTDYWPEGQKTWSTHALYLRTIVSDLHQSGELNVRSIVFPTQRKEDGIGADWHPSVNTHKKMADTWAQALKKDLKW